MTDPLPQPPGFWKTVRLLLRASRKRSGGRRTRQQELLHQRSSSTDWSAIGFVFTVVVMAVLNSLAAYVVRTSVTVGERIEAERKGKIVVSRRFLNAVMQAEIAPRYYFNNDPERSAVSSFYTSEAHRISERYGGKEDDIAQNLRRAVETDGNRDFVVEGEVAPGLNALATAGPLPAMLGSVALLWWGIMLVFQGEGLELDLQRRRHPMWEWLFSHPVRPGPVFLAEMLSPIAANPIYWSGPLFAGFLYSMVYDPGAGLLATLLIGVPITVSAACLGKAFEIGVVLRFSPRTRGAMIGFMSWLGYASMMLFFVGVFVVPKIAAMTARLLGLFAALPWPWLGWFLGGQADGSFSFLAGLLNCWIASGRVVGAAMWFSVWGAQRGLSGNFGSTDARPARTGGVRFGREPLYRKEYLWFIRDRSAIVQTILVPVTVAGLQIFNLHGVLSYAQGAWNYLCGVGILFGTYFLWILGPRSLASEGTALWIALTWPRGLESLLKAKAWLWSMISTGMVLLVLAYAAFVFPGKVWSIALVGVGWFFFGRSMAEKAVTLVTVSSESGEPQKIPSGRRWAAQLGMLTFSIGVLTQQWHVAIVGIVYSYITAAAMWQNFRARLPYLYDPWSEKLPPPPTLMHAMISISILIEAGAVVTGFIVGVGGRENIAIAQAIGYSVCAAIVTVGVTSFLGARGVVASDIWRWPRTASAASEPEPWWRSDGSNKRKFATLIAMGAGAGIVLGLVALAYLAVLHHVPATAEMLRKSEELMARIPALKLWYAFMAIAVAPFAEEYLFRGLLFRALDREWGGWRAVLGSAAFFAIYHPALSWFPVALLGMANALIFKKTGRLAPAVALHMLYNAVVVLT